MEPKLEKPQPSGLITCPVCNGAGEIPSDDEGYETCSLCDGFGKINNL